MKAFNKLTPPALAASLALLAACAQPLPTKPSPAKPTAVASSKPATKAAAKPAAKPATKPADKPVETIPEVVEAPKTPEQRFDTAVGLMKSKKNKDAEKVLVDLIKEAPEYSGVWTNYGILLAKGKQRDKAMTMLGQAVGLNPKNVTALNWLGSLQREAGQFAQAETTFLKALAVKPDDARTHFNLGLLYDVALNQPAAALTHYQAAQKTLPDPRLKVWIARLTAVPVSTPVSAPAAPVATTGKTL
jgi:tetratricopeptide (TPR) repeat protein